MWQIFYKPSHVCQNQLTLVLTFTYDHPTSTFILVNRGRIRFSYRLNYPALHPEIPYRIPRKSRSRIVRTGEIAVPIVADRAEKSVSVLAAYPLNGVP